MMKIKQTVVSLSLVTAVSLYVGACATNPADKAPPEQSGYDQTRSRPDRSVDISKAPDKRASVSPVKPVGREGEIRSELFPGTGRFIDTIAASRQAYSTASGGDLTLNFQGSDIQEVIKTILGDILQVNYAIDEKIKGPVYLQTSEPIGRNALIPTLEALLRMKGAVLIQSDNLYKIVPQSAALSSAVSPQTRLIRDKGYQILVVPLRYIAAKEMEKILKPLQPTNGLVQVDSNRNLLILAGTQVELAHLLKTVKIFDIDQLEGMSVGFFRLTSVDATTILGELEEIFGDSAEGAVAGMVRFVPIERLNALLVITPQSKYLKDAQLWIDRLDHVEASTGVGLHVYYVQNSRAAHIADLLGQLFDNERSIKEGLRPLSLAPGAKPAVIQSAVMTSERDSDTQNVPSKNAVNRQPGTTAEKSKRSTDRNNGASVATVPGAGEVDVGDVTIIADEENNALIVKATLADYDKIERAIRKLDILPLQVLIEVTIVDVALTDEFSFGLEWFFKSKHGSKRARGLLDLGGPGIAPIVPGFSYTVVDSADVVRAVLNTLASESKVNVLSSPSLMVLDNRTASIRVGDQVPIRTSQGASIATSGEESIIASTIQQLDTGILLEVTPRVNASGLVTMDITQEVNDAVPTQSSGIDSPTISQRRIQTTVAVQSGETIVLGGLIRESKSRSQSGVPGLRKIPIIGWLFGAKSKTHDRTELLVLITPTAIKDQGEARAVTDEFREKMKNLTFPEWFSGREEPEESKSQRPVLGDGQL
jgi:general secretion pathway protein D